MFSVKPKLKFSLFIILIISKLIWKKMLNSYILSFDVQTRGFEKIY